jgi:TolB protein
MIGKSKLLLLMIVFISIGSLYLFLHYENRFQLIQLTSTDENEFFCSWSPYGSKILYNSNNTLWMLDFKTKDKVKLTSKLAGCGRFSPDGRKIAFEAGKNLEKEKYTSGRLWELNLNICVMNLEDRKTRCLTSKGFNYYPKWSPDGKKIAFLRIEKSGRHLWVVNADGGNQTPLTHDMGNVECWSYDWSPDGKRIVFSANVSGERGIWIMNADGSGKERIASGTSPKWVSENAVFYLGNNSYLHRITLDGRAGLVVKDAIVCYSTYDNAIVYKNLKGISISYDGKKKELTAKFQDLCPAFSSDGKIAFTSERTGNADIWLIVWKKRPILESWFSGFVSIQR